MRTCGDCLLFELDEIEDGDGQGGCRAVISPLPLCCLYTEWDTIDATTDATDCPCFKRREE